MKLLKPNKKWVLAVIGLLLALFILKFVLFLTAKPKITVDYVAEYNRASLPPDYNPEDNAAPHYQKAFDSFVKPPDEVGWIIRTPSINWPTGINDTEQVLLEKWLNSNTLAFEYLREASNKPYYWIERKSEDNSISGMTFPELHSFRELSRTLIWDAKVKAVKGEFKSAFENILTCYKAGSHQCCPNLGYIEQQTGLAIRRESIDGTIVILDRTKVPREDLEFFQDALQKELDNESYVPSIQMQKYFVYDTLQRTFIDNGKGTGRLAWRIARHYSWYSYSFDETFRDKLRYKWDDFKRRLHACFIGPTRNEIEKQIEQLISISDQMMNKTPWQIKNEESDYAKEIQKIEGSNYFFVEDLCATMRRLSHSYHKTKAQTEALITVLAILRFKADYNRLPETLDELVSTNYLKSLPMDPYSSGPLTYKIEGDNFKLYSWGENFKDDGGIKYMPDETHTSGIHQSPRFRYPLDEIYWSVKSLDKAQYEKIQKQMYERAREFGPPPISRGE